jgi:hydrophobe/amphiphile efflux-3 (HAE3) family protein
MSFWTRLGGFVGRHARGVLAGVIAVVVVFALGALNIGFDTSQDALIGANSQVALDNVQYQKAFGGEPMLVMFSGSVNDLTSSAKLEQVRRLEAALKRSGKFYSVIGPYNTLRYVQRQVGKGTTLFPQAEAADPAHKDRIGTTFQSEVERQIQTGVPFDRLTDPASLKDGGFVQFLLRDPSGRIRGGLSDTFPNERHALMIVRLEPNLPIGDMGAAADAVKQIVAAHPIAGHPAVVTGPPVLLQSINDYLQGGMFKLGGLAVLVMAFVLFFLFRVRWRMLSLGVVVLGALATFGLMGFLGIQLTLVTISGFPILIGLAVDFSIQIQARFEEEVHRDGDGPAALVRTYCGLGWPLTVAMLAAILGFIALQVSRVPMIRDFGIMLDIGVFMLFVIVLLVPPAVLILREKHKPTAATSHASGGLERGVRSVVLLARRVLVPIMILALLVTVAGFAVENQFTIQTDPERWISQDSQTVAQLKELRAGAGFSSELGVMIEAADVKSTAVSQWMQRFGEAEVAKHNKVLIHPLSLPAIITSVTTGTPDAAQMDTILSVTPRDFRISFIAGSATKANLIFPIREVSLSERQALIESMQRDISSGPLAAPAGVRATPSGLAVVGVELVKALDANRLEMTYFALGIVFLLLLLAFRSLWKTLLPLIPVVVSVGASSLAIYALGLELSPLTAVSGPLVIAVCTEFSVLIMSRYVEERENGRSPEDAVEVGAVRIGRAFVASGLTLVGGFGVLALSSFPLLSDFGIIVSLNALLAMLIALLVLPSLLMWADRSRFIKGFSPGPRDGGSGGDGTGSQLQPTLPQPAGDRVRV